jgi:hypothetical protein
MKFRSTWILVVILALVASYFFLVEERNKKTETQRKTGTRNVLSYGRDEVETVVLINPRKDRIVMERDGEGWTITHPTRTKGSTPTIDAFLMQIVPGLKLEEFLDVGDLSDFGFDDPFATVILTARGAGRPDTIYVGDKTPTSAKCYIRLAGSRDVVITRELTHNAMNKTLYHLRSKSLLDAGIDDIDRLTIRNSGARIELIKRKNDWRIDDSPYRADRLTIEQYLNALTSAIIREFTREDLGERGSFGLAHPTRELVLGLDGDEITLSFGRTEENMVYAIRSGIQKVLRLEANLLDIFYIDEKMFRSRDLTSFDIDDVRTVRVETADTMIVVARQGRIWRTPGPGPVTIAQHVVKRLLNELRIIRYEELFDAVSAPPEIQDDAPTITITLEDESGSEIDLVMISRTAAGYEIGSSTSAKAFGRLPDGTGRRISQLLLQLSE